MSKLDELIQEYCPNGVEYKRLEDCCTILDKKRKPVTKAEREAGEYPYYGANGIQDYVSDYIFDGTFVLVGEDGSVITRAGTPVVTWAEGKIWVNNHAHIIKETDSVLLRYLFHFLQTIDVTPLIHGNIPKLTGKDFRSLKIPVPPLPVQREIVRILDHFTEFTEELTKELTAELTARKKQYEFYRDHLMTFADVLEGEATGVVWRTLGELGAFFGGLTGKSKDDFVDGNAKLITYKNVYSNPALQIDVEDRVKIAEGEKQRTLQYGDVIFTGSSETPDECGFSSVVTTKTDEKLYLNSFCFFFRFHDSQIMLPDFAKHLFRTNDLRYQITKTANGVTRFNVSKKLMKNVKVPLPPLDVQKRLVNVLDNFDAICADLNIGLPAEIHARQKQYEFYRDALLTYATTGGTIFRERGA